MYEFLNHNASARPLPHADGPKRPSALSYINYFGQVIPLSTWESGMSSHGSFFALNKPLLADPDHQTRLKLPMFFAFGAPPDLNDPDKACCQLCDTLHTYLLKNTGDKKIAVYGCTEGQTIFVFVNVGMDIVYLLFLKNLLATKLPHLSQQLMLLSKYYRPAAQVPTLFDSRIRPEYDSTLGGQLRGKTIALRSLSECCRRLFFADKCTIPSAAVLSTGFPRLCDIVQLGAWTGTPWKFVLKVLRAWGKKCDQTKNAGLDRGLKLLSGLEEVSDTRISKAVTNVHQLRPQRSETFTAHTFLTI